MATSLEEYSSVITAMAMSRIKNEENLTERKVEHRVTRRQQLSKLLYFYANCHQIFRISSHLIQKHHRHQQHYCLAPCWHLGCCNHAGRMPLTESLDFPWHFPIQHYRAWLCLTRKIRQDLSQSCMATYFLNPPTSCHVKKTSYKCPTT